MQIQEGYEVIWIVLGLYPDTTQIAVLALFRDEAEAKALRDRLIAEGVVVVCRPELCKFPGRGLGCEDGPLK